MNEGLQFRTSAFGGFNKQDVMAYLEKSAREHSGKIAELQKELTKYLRAGYVSEAELRQARTEAEDAGETMKSRLAVLEAENQRLAADLAQREAALAQALERGEAQAAELTVLKEEAETLRPAAASYESIKSRTASIELEAHGRAQAIEQEGRVRAKKAQEQVLDWFDKMQAAYLRLRTDIDATLHHAAREMERAGQSLVDLDTALGGHDKTLAELRQAAEHLEPQAPQPLPLEGEQG